MSDVRKRESRRKLLRALTVTGGAAAGWAVLPEKWTKPIIDRVEIPAHAQASGPAFTLSFFQPAANQEVFQGRANLPFTVITTPPIDGVSVTVTSGMPTAIAINSPATGPTAGGGAFSGTFNVLTPNIPPLTPVTLTATAGSRTATVTVLVNAA